MKMQKTTKGKFLFRPVLVALIMLIPVAASADEQPWNWLWGPYPNPIIFDGENLRDPEGTVLYGRDFWFQRSLFWDFEDPLFPEYPDFWGRLDPIFADYLKNWPDPDSLHDGPDDYDFSQASIIGGRLIIPDGKEVVFLLRNLDEDNPAKHQWVQLDYWCAAEVQHKIIEMLDPNGVQPPVAFEYAHDPADVDKWGTILLYFRWEPNPLWDGLIIRNSDGSDLYIDNVRFVTMCIPEPGTMTLLAIGGMMLLWWRRRGGR